MSDERLSPDLPSLPLTLSAFLEMVTAPLDRLHGADAAPVQVRGIPTKGGSGKVYSGFVYADSAPWTRASWLIPSWPSASVLSRSATRITPQTR